MNDVNFSVVVLLIVSGWALLSIVVSLGFGGSAKTRDTAIDPTLRFPASNYLADPQTDRAAQDTAARRIA